MKKNMWMVRAGEGAIIFNDFKEKNVIAIGWKEVGNLTSVNDQTQLKNIIRETYSEEKQGRIRMAAVQVIRFRFEFKSGDYVITYNPQERRYLVGEITGDYEYNRKLIENYPNIRKVKWIDEIDRDRLSTSTKNTLGAISTIFDVGDDAREEILNLLRGKEIREESPDETEDVIKEDMKERAHEFIKDKVSKLDWSDMQRLVAGILRAMGYKTRISPQGPDRGRDIEASPDGLGLTDPRIVVEVKHRKNQTIGSSEVRGFTGGLREGNKAIYVSTGGFTKEAKYEAERSNIPTTLIDSDALVKLIVQYYDSFDSETKSLVPLTKIFWPE
jgi:restriction system protein